MTPRQSHREQHEPQENADERGHYRVLYDQEAARGAAAAAGWLAWHSLEAVTDVLNDLRHQYAVHVIE